MNFVASGWLLVQRGPHASLCPLLVDRRRLTRVLWTSLVRADAAFSHEYAACGIWLALLDHYHNADNAILVRVNSQLMGDLGQFDLSLQRLMNVGLPSAHARTLTAKLLGDSGSLQALANTSSQTMVPVVHWISHVSMQSRRLMSDYTSLLHVLSRPRPVEPRDARG